MSFKKFISSLKNLATITKIIDNPTLYLNAVENLPSVPKTYLPAPKPKTSQHLDTFTSVTNEIQAPNPLIRYKFVTTIDNGITRECVKFEEAYQTNPTKNVKVNQQNYQKVTFPIEVTKKAPELMLARQLSELQQETVRLKQQIKDLTDRSKSLQSGATTVYLPNDSKFLMLKIVKADLVSKLNFADDTVEATAKEKLEDVKMEKKGDKVTPVENIVPKEQKSKEVIVPKQEKSKEVIVPKEEKHKVEKTVSEVIEVKPSPELILIKKKVGSVSEKVEPDPDTIPKVLTRVQVKGYESFAKTIENLEKEKKRIIVFFTADKDETGKSWCPTCNDATKVIDQKIEILPKDRVLVIAEIGQPDLYYDRRNPFKMDKRCAIITVPVLMRWGSERRLTGYECVQPELVEMLFQVEAEENGTKS